MVRVFILKGECGGWHSTSCRYSINGAIIIIIIHLIITADRMYLLQLSTPAPNQIYAFFNAEIHSYYITWMARQKIIVLEKSYVKPQNIGSQLWLHIRITWGDF